MGQDLSDICTRIAKIEEQMDKEEREREKIPALVQQKINEALKEKASETMDVISLVRDVRLCISSIVPSFSDELLNKFQEALVPRNPCGLYEIAQEEIVKRRVKKGL